jgi:16S rRNA (guanine966-N2)-methyltransferase
MRIISGSHRSRRIIPPANLPVRPTTDLAKESLFNILWNYVDIEKCRVLDLFAGTGNLSYEFASRNCIEVVSVEINHRCTDFINKTALSLNFKSIKVVRADVFHFLNRQGSPFDIVFADPPYDLKDIMSIPDRVLNNNWLNQDGFLILEHPGTLDFRMQASFMEVRNYGKAHFSFFHKE